MKINVIHIVQSRNIDPTVGWDLDRSLPVQDRPSVRMRGKDEYILKADEPRIGMNASLAIT
jgi:hypothetical protein